MIFNDFLKIKEKDIDKLKTVTNFNNIFDNLLGVIQSMLQYNNVPTSLNTDFLELYKIKNGYSGVGMVNNELVCTYGSFTDDLNNYGIGENYTGHTLNGNELSGIVDKDIIICRNNKLYRPDIDDIFIYAQIINNVDISLDFNVFYTQYAPLIECDNQKQKDIIDLWIKNKHEGHPVTVIKDKPLDFLDNEKNTSINVKQLGDVKDVDKLQYLSKYRDDVMKRFYTQYGHNLNSTEKLAQQSVKEISNNDTVALIYSLNRLQCAKEDIEKINNRFNTSITVDFSLPWKLVLNKIQNNFFDNENKGGENNENN